MSTAYVVVTVVTALLVAYTAYAAISRAKWVAQNLADYGVPGPWLPWLGTLKAAGAVGLVLGLFVPVLGVMAAAGLVVYFIGAVITVIHAHFYTHLQYPVMFLAPVAAAMALRLST